ncbi:pyruvate kinase [Brumimicrobium aurantiacum]|uniref:Pyruvate kinase n=1 Tax=Brumimicrobium aurantiacum TaxID=1737063 RepID=A0A3E1EVK0_9FLAO|nr:pyruvate kinase [Brumimicrobium aurantiacum]RFC53581.1 pyruvate kinase [Brumimicrobium aurantiacum]
MKRTKIVATIGPASSSKQVLKGMMEAGMNVARINFSHGSYENHEEVIQNIRELNEETGLNIAILADLQGPKIRTREMENNGVELVPGENVEIVTDEDVVGTSARFSINYTQLAADIKPGEHIRLDDGKLELKVVSTDGKVIQAVVTHGGILSSNKGVNLPNTVISLPSLTEKDTNDLQFAMEHDVDWIGLSFVRSTRDIIELKHIISKNRNKAKIVAKIEKPEAIKDIDGIIKETDAIMVARGDLGVEIPMEDVPLVQKMLIKKCYLHAKPIIVATQMMESMIEDYTPTRAEVNDVANAVLDGTDAVMLSGETSVGKHPITVIQAMDKIVRKIEESDMIYYKEEVPEKNQERFISDSICFNATRLGNRVDAKAIVTMTFSGYTAYKIASQRPKSQIFVFTSNREILTQLNLVWGVRAIYYDKMVSTDHTIADIKYILKDKGFLSKGELVINVASMPIESKGKSNMLRLSYIE